MKRKLLSILLATTLAAGAIALPAHAQMAVFDGSNFAQNVLQAARALQEDKGVIPVIFLRNTWAGRRDRVVYDPSPVNHTTAVLARPPN